MQEGRIFQWKKHGNGRKSARENKEKKSRNLVPEKGQNETGVYFTKTHCQNKDGKKWRRKRVEDDQIADRGGEPPAFQRKTGFIPCGIHNPGQRKAEEIKKNF